VEEKSRVDEDLSRWPLFKKIIALAAVDAGGKTRTVQLENNVVRSNNTKSKKKEDTNITHGMQDPIFFFCKPTKSH
jgi:hypothetical protein